MSDTPKLEPPAGWYENPSDKSQLRWWDGVRWSEHTHPAGTLTPRGSAPAPATQVIVVVNRKSMAVALILTFLFGPLGMLYATVAGALAMMAVNFVILMVGLATGGFGLLALIPAWLGEMLWAGVAVSNHNRDVHIR